MKSEIEMVMENNDTKIMILSMKSNPAADSIEIFRRKPKRKAENVVKSALSLIIDP